MTLPPMSLRKLRSLNFPYYVSTMFSVLWPIIIACSLGSPFWLKPSLATHVFDHWLSPSFYSSFFTGVFSFVINKVSLRLKTKQKKTPSTLKSNLALSCLIQISLNSFFYFPFLIFSSTHFLPYLSEIRFQQCYRMNCVPLTQKFICWNPNP